MEPVPAVGDTLHLNLEKVIAQNPTVAFAVTKRTDLPQALQRLGVRCVALESDTMAELLDAVRSIGRETGHTAEAEALVRKMQADLEAVRRRVAGRPRPSVLFAFPIMIGSPQIMVAGRGTFVDNLINAAGGRNAYPEAGDWPTVSAQRAIALAPEVVIVSAAGDDAAPDRIEAVRRAWAHWTSIPAVSSGRVHILTEPYLTIPGPRVGLAAQRLADVIHPETAAPAGESPAASAAGSAAAAAGASP